MLKVENLKVGFPGNPVLEGLDIEIRDNARVVVVGENGSGKTTLFRSMLGLAAPESGTVSYDGAEIGSGTRIMGVSGNLPECYRFLPLSCRDLVLAYSELKEMDSGQVLELMRDFSLGRILTWKPWKLSTGEQKLLYTILALKSATRLAILDEPFENIDFQRKQKLVDLIAGTDLSVLLSTHDSTVLEGLRGWEMYIMLAGKLFGPLDPVQAGKYFFNEGEPDDAALAFTISGKRYSITLGSGDIPLASIERVSSAAGGKQQ